MTQRYGLLILILLSVTGYAHAEGDGLSDIPLGQCDLNTVNSSLSYQSMEHNLSMDNRFRAYEHDYNEIAAKLPADNSASKNPLSPEEHAKYIRLTTNYQILLGQRLIESEYMRDREFIQKLVQTANSYYLRKITLDEKNPDFALMTLMVWREKLKFPDNDNVPTVCNMDFALHLLEPEHLQKFGRLENDLDSAKKENLKTHIKNQLSTEATYLLDIENIRRFARMSALIYQSNLKDITNSKGDLDTVGNTLKNLKKENKLDADDQLMITMWQYINEKVPSKIMRDSTTIKK